MGHRQKTNATGKDVRAKAKSECGASVEWKGGGEISVELSCSKQIGHGTLYMELRKQHICSSQQSFDMFLIISAFHFVFWHKNMYILNV